MTVRQYVEKLRSRGIRLRLEGDDLRVTAPRDTLDPDLRDTLRRRKDELVEYLRADGTDGAGPDAAAPLSFAQERMWFLDRLEPGSTAYNRPYAFRLRGDLDREAFVGSLRRILERHEALRTRFRMVDGDAVQHVVPPPGAELRTVDLSDAGKRGGRRLAEVLEDEARTPFDLTEGPLARFLLVRLGADEHVFLHNVHHSVSDGWSTGILHRELSELYAARTRGRTPELPEPEVRYAEFARWQRRRLDDERLAPSLDYWIDRLGGDLPPLDLPLDHPRPPVQTYRGAREAASIPADLADELRALARRDGATLFMTLLAAYAAVLHRYSGQTDLAVGTPVAGRSREELEDVIGLFINTLVLRTDLEGDPTFRELLGRVRDTTLEALEHQEVPFEKVVEALRPERTVSHHPLFQVLFTYHDAEHGGLDLPGLEVSPVEVDRGATYMDLDLTVADTGEELRVGLRYNTDLFEAGTARRFLGHYRTLLEGAAAEPDRRLSELPLLTEHERRRILVDWNDTDADLGSPRPVERLFRERARAAPDRTALDAGGRSVAYGELDARVDRLARRLRRRGAGRGTLVGVATGRTPGMVVSLLAVHRAGAAYLPLDPSLPGERIRFMLDDAGAEIVVADRRGRDALPPVGLELVEVDARGEAPDGGDPERTEEPAGAGAGEPTGPDDLAYTIYTSGSTGRPKGVEVPHGAVYNFVRAMAREPGIDQDDRVLAVTTPSFDISVLELFLPLAVGARIVLADEETAADGHALLDAVRRKDVTVLQATPATWRLLLEAGWEGEEPLRVLCGGEAMPPDLARRLTDRSPEVWNLYGPTETTVWSARYRLPPEGEPVRIGRPVENTSLYVLDAAGRPVPVGVPGELFIGGAGVTKGYHDRPGRNDAAFLPDPFADDPDARMYRTGDRVRWRPDGTLEFLGRLDRQVKIRGFRIEPGEIEAVLCELDEVDEAAVAVREDRIDDKRLVAWIVFAAGRSLTTSEVRGRLLERLPDYMVPSLVVEMEELPLTPSGKVDRGALPDPLGAGPGAGQRFEEPSSGTERLVAEIWSELLGVERVGRRDNFFDLGGHSLLSMRAVHRIEERTGERLNPRVMILNTLEQVAAEIDRRAADDAAPEPTPTLEVR